MNDNVYIFGENQTNYVPFQNYENNCEEEYNYNSSNKNFCPVCGYNLNSNKHRQLCGNPVPIENEELILSVFLLIYNAKQNKMEIIKENYQYRKDIDILIRVYKNQDIDNENEKEQICTEILFKNYVGLDNIFATSWLPRGAVVFIVQTLNSLNPNHYKIQISNELDDNIGVLTSCIYNFDNSLEWRLLKY